MLTYTEDRNFTFGTVDQQAYRWGGPKGKLKGTATLNDLGIPEPPHKRRGTILNYGKKEVVDNWRGYKQKEPENNTHDKLKMGCRIHRKEDKFTNNPTRHRMAELLPNGSWEGCSTVLSEPEKSRIG